MVCCLHRGPNAWILAFSVVIASVGLNVNSIPVIIGAMLISPLMGPIFGAGFSLGTNDMELMVTSLKNLAVMMAIALIASVLYFLVTPLTLTNPTEILGGEDGRVCGMKCIKMELGEPDASGRRRPIPIEGSEFVLDVDMVIMSLGTSPNPLIRSTTPGLETNKKGDKAHKK